ncbi:hypothetical protein FOQG_08785 [Fusarium oxysporum f. sp. raphani 54005]|uniref:Zn(2)-C6 fungal-type domain-containing protein n=1 Tax=Fusarium oxysporum f. sp. raphani 54005 TaxID=1089458 RepID=X0CAN9_FUSOX|nr:hypothetical protein FOQG_08785 [Fusarium oxysporum f. sp. raphani 54005]
MATPYQAPACPVYSKPLSTHQNECPFCQKSFRRADVARRHARSCNARQGRPLPPQAKRGRKLRACNNCARVKVSCDSELPCHRCSARGIDCVYSSLCYDPSHRATFKPREVCKDDRPSFSFLLQASNPNHPSMDAIVAREPERTSEIPAWKQRETETVGWSSGTVDPRFLLFDLSDMLLDEPQDYGDTENNPLQFSGIFGPSTDSIDALSTRIVTLSNILQGLTTNKPHLGEGLDQSCQRGFFTTSHFQHVLVFFFRRRHYHQDTIHWPTFDPEKVSLHLLLAVVLTGTVYLQCLNQSSPSYINTPLLELAEKYVYKELKELSGQDVSPVTSQHMLEICQAAVLMNTLEGSANHIEARRRIASKRIPTLVATLRKSNMMSLKHEPGKSWQDFVHRETCIRVVTWTFMNDSLLGLFCNHPPIITSEEMTGDLPCPSDIWEADSSLVFQERSRYRLTRSYPSSCSEAIAGMLDEEWTPATRDSFGKLDHSDLFYLSSGLGRHIFHYRTSVVSPDYSKMLLRALDRWDSLWMDAFERIPEDERRWLGIGKHTPEVMALSRRTIELIESGEAKNTAYLQDIACYDTAVFHDFVQKYGQESPGTAKN